MIKDILEKAKEKRIAVIGDLILDAYLFGEVERISPEAPVPIVLENDIKYNLGGACNVALNLKTLGANVDIYGIVGKDKEADILTKLLEDSKINIEGIIPLEDRPTTFKVRVIAKHQQILRIDREKTQWIEPQVEEVILSKIQKKHYDAVIFEDYNKGLLSKNLINKISKNFNNTFIAVDPKFFNFFEYKNADLFKPNLKELLKAFNTYSKYESIYELARKLKEKINAKIVLITLGERGSLLLNREGMWEIPALKREVYDVTGAGDTVIAIMTLLKILDLDDLSSALWANIAAGIEITKLGASPVKKEELINVEKEFEELRKNIRKL